MNFTLKELEMLGEVLNSKLRQIESTINEYEEEWQKSNGKNAMAGRKAEILSERYMKMLTLAVKVKDMELEAE